LTAQKTAGWRSSSSSSRQYPQVAVQGKARRASSCSRSGTSLGALHLLGVSLLQAAQEKEEQQQEEEKEQEQLPL
jgi:hypothetical protein